MLHYNRHEKVANFKIVRKSNQKPDFLFLIFFIYKTCCSFVKCWKFHLQDIIRKANKGWKKCFWKTLKSVKKKIKSKNMAVKNIKVFLTMKNKGCLSKEMQILWNAGK